MKRKKLSLMDISDDETLSRDDMKYIMAGSGGTGGCDDCASGHFSGDSFCYCTYQGCWAYLVQCSSGWLLRTCSGCWTGSGSYGGTICGGKC